MKGGARGHDGGHSRMLDHASACGSYTRSSRTRSPRRRSTAAPTPHQERLHGRLRDHRRAHRPTRGRAGQGRACDPAGGDRHRRARRHALAGRQRDPKAHDIFRPIESLPFARESSDLFDRPSINLGRILGGDALNKVPDRCVIDVDIRYLPDRTPGDPRPGARARPTWRSWRCFTGRPRSWTDNPFVLVLREAGASAGLRADERRPRRRLGRDLLHPGGRAGGRVRPDRRGAPRAPGVGLDRLARATAARWWTSCA